MNNQKLFDVLGKLQLIDFDNPIEFIQTAIPEFVSALGYDQSQLFFEVAFLHGERRLLADAIIAESRINRPWILIEAKLATRTDRAAPADWIHQLLYYLKASNAKYGVLFSPEILIIIPNNPSQDLQIREYYLRTITSIQIDEISSLLNRPEFLPSDTALTSDFRPLNPEHFQINLSIYSQLLRDTLNAKTNDEKKKAFEKLARFLFEGIPFLKCKYSNLVTRSSEIDIVLEYLGFSRPTIFDEFGRYILIECKNWKSSVGAKQVRDFLGKLQKSRIRLGIIFAKNGISGESNGADAVREIHSVFDKEGTYVLIISEEDLLAIEKGENFYQLLDKKLDELRFDI